MRFYFEPPHIDVEQTDDGLWIAYESFTLRYGVGETPRKAVWAYLESIVDMGVTHETEPDSALGKGMFLEVDQIRRFVKEVK